MSARNPALVCTWVCVLISGCNARPSFNAEDARIEDVGKGFGEGFLLGTATAAHQIEGGLTNDWSEWEKGSFDDGRPHIVGEDRSTVAADGGWESDKTKARFANFTGRVAQAMATKELRARDTVDADGDGEATKVGIAHHVRVFQPATQSTLDVAVAGLTDEFFNESIIQAVKTGRIRLTVPGRWRSTAKCRISRGRSITSG